MSVSINRVRTEKPIYSNLDHRINEAVAAQLRDEAYFAQHAAWNFCGYVYRKGGTWYNEVWQWNAPVETIEGATLPEVITAACDAYGRE